MITIDKNTKIATLISANPAVLDAIISISPKFKKLKNPVMRKLMAPRASILMASKAGGCSVEEFFSKLEPLGFRIDRKESVSVEGINQNAEEFDAIYMHFHGELDTIDVRMMEMPLPMVTIIDAVDKLPLHKALFVYHKRIPVFLLPELKEKGFDYRIKEISEGEVHMLIFRK